MSPSRAAARKTSTSRRARRGRRPARVGLPGPRTSWRARLASFFVVTGSGRRSGRSGRTARRTGRAARTPPAPPVRAGRARRAGPDRPRPPARPAPRAWAACLGRRGCSRRGRRPALAVPERLLPPGRPGPQHVEAHPRHDRRQPAAEVGDAARLGPLVAEPGLLDGVVRSWTPPASAGRPAVRRGRCRELVVPVDGAFAWCGHPVTSSSAIRHGGDDPTIGSPRETPMTVHMVRFTATPRRRTTSRRASPPSSPWSTRPDPPARASVTTARRTARASSPSSNSTRSSTTRSRHPRCPRVPGLAGELGHDPAGPEAPHPPGLVPAGA